MYVYPQSIQALERINSRVYLGNYLAGTLSLSPLVKLYLSPKSVTQLSQDIYEYHWEEFGQAMAGVNKVLRYRVWEEANMVADYTSGEERVFLFTGCTSVATGNHDLYTKYKQYETRVGFCLNEAREDNYSLLHSEWLRSLDEEAQKQVIIYLSSLVMSECSAKEKEDLILALGNETEDVQKIITKSLYLDIPTKPKPAGVDEVQLDILASQISSPFSTFGAFETLQNVQ